MGCFGAYSDVLILSNEARKPLLRKEVVCSCVLWVGVKTKKHTLRTYVGKKQMKSMGVGVVVLY